MIKSKIFLVATSVLGVLCVNAAAMAEAATTRVQRALVFSVDGMHAVDLALYIQRHPQSNFAALARRGVNYPNARTPLLGDSSPGLVSLFTGGTPAVTGIHYSPMYDRSLSPAAGSSASCKLRSFTIPP